VGLKPWNKEADAGKVLRSQLGGVVRERDPGGGAEQLHDFDLVLDDGRTIAVEVTQYTDADALATKHEVAKRDWHSKALHSNWSVSMVPVYNVGNVLGFPSSQPPAAFGAGDLVALSHVSGNDGVGIRGRGGREH
jgi:hypothetical protein